ncbi:hypothetical protein RJZ56_005443 [Blastomyces dermatitidis]
MPQELAEGCGKRVAKDCRRGIRRLTICVPCLLQFSGAEVQQQGQDEELWARGVELMNNFISDTGCFKHWDGRRGFLSREARNEEERKAWLKALPFVDYEETE